MIFIFIKEWFITINLEIWNNNKEKFNKWNRNVELNNSKLRILKGFLKWNNQFIKRKQRI